MRHAAVYEKEHLSVQEVSTTSHDDLNRIFLDPDSSQLRPASPRI